MVPQVKAPKNFSQWTYKGLILIVTKVFPYIIQIFIGSPKNNANKENKQLSFNIIYFLNVSNSNIFKLFLNLNLNYSTFPFLNIWLANVADVLVLEEHFWTDLRNFQIDSALFHIVSPSNSNHGITYNFFTFNAEA